MFKMIRKATIWPYEQLRSRKDLQCVVVAVLWCRSVADHNSYGVLRCYAVAPNCVGAYFTGSGFYN